MIFNELEVYLDYSYIATKNGYDTLSGICYLLRDTTIELELKLTTHVPDKYPEQPIVYPVPSGNFLTIGSSENIIRIELYNIIGEIVKIVEFKNVASQIDISGLEDGMYILKMIMEDGGTVQKKIPKKVID